MIWSYRDYLIRAYNANMPFDRFVKELGGRSPEADPFRFTRFQDVRLYARALSPAEVARLPYENYIAELANKRTSKWNMDEWHAASQFYFTSVDDKAKD